MDLLLEIVADSRETEAAVIPLICWVLTGHKLLKRALTSVQRESMRQFVEDGHVPGIEFHVRRTGPLVSALKSCAEAVDDKVQVVKDGRFPAKKHAFACVVMLDY